MSILAGRAIAITGAGSGIGRALALGLAKCGAKVALCDKSADALAETGRMLGNHPHSTTAFDVTDDTALKAWIDSAAAEYGGLDGIINNAGLTVVAPFEDTPQADFDRVMAVNFGAVVAGCRHALPHLRNSDSAWLVNISSVFGMMGYPSQSAYNASKYAVRGLTEALYMELSKSDPHIAVMRVHPGGIKTNVARNAKVIKAADGNMSATDFSKAFDKMAHTTPEVAAETIIRGMEARSHRVLIGGDARMIDWITRFFPVRYPSVMARLMGGAKA